MCCLLTILIVLGPRIAGIFWWLFQPNRWVSAAGAFDSFIWPLLGIIFLPWTTLMYVLLFWNGLSIFDWVFIVLAVIADLSSYGGGAYGNRSRFSST